MGGGLTVLRGSRQTDQEAVNTVQPSQEGVPDCSICIRTGMGPSTECCRKRSPILLGTPLFLVRGPQPDRPWSGVLAEEGKTGAPFWQASELAELQQENSHCPHRSIHRMCLSVSASHSRRSVSFFFVLFRSFSFFHFIVCRSIESATPGSFVMMRFLKCRLCLFFSVRPLPPLECLGRCGRVCRSCTAGVCDLLDQKPQRRSWRTRTLPGQAAGPQKAPKAPKERSVFMHLQAHPFWCVCASPMDGQDLMHAARCTDQPCMEHGRCEKGGKKGRRRTRARLGDQTRQIRG